MATTSGAVASIGALLSKIHSYCKTKRLTCIAYNMVVMAGQAAARERAEQALENQEDNDEENATSNQASNSANLSQIESI